MILAIFMRPLPHQIQYHTPNPDVDVPFCCALYDILAATSANDHEYPFWVSRQTQVATDHRAQAIGVNANTWYPLVQ